MSDKGYSRRSVAIGGGIAAALGITALGVTVPRFLRHKYRQTAYDDLLDQLVDRDAAIKVGHAILAGGGAFDAKATARALRQRFERRTLGEVTDSDLTQGNLVEAQGWVLPQSLGQLCELATDES